MIEAGRTIVNSVTGERIVFRKTSRETDGAAVVIETYVDEPQGHAEPAPARRDRERALRHGTAPVPACARAADRTRARRARRAPCGLSPELPARERMNGRLRLRLLIALVILAALVLAGVGVLRSWGRRCAVTISTAFA
jgi:hypothetical protein